MNTWIKAAFSAGSLVAVATLGWQALKYFDQIPSPLRRYAEQRVLPPQLTGPAGTVQPGDLYTLTWVPATGPEPQYYVLQVATDGTFATIVKERQIQHEAGKTPQDDGGTVVPDGPFTRWYRVLAGRKKVLSEPSNAVSLTVDALPEIAVSAEPGAVFSGQEYTLSWSSPSPKANAYEVLETITAPGATTLPGVPRKTEQEHRFCDVDLVVSDRKKRFVAPVLGKDAAGKYNNEVRSYQVRAAVADPYDCEHGNTHNWVRITDWSKGADVTVRPVVPPVITITPGAVHSSQPYTVSWKQPSPGPLPVAQYSYILHEDPPQSPQGIPPLSQTQYGALAPQVTAATQIRYDVEVYFGNNPMTMRSQPATITVAPFAR